MTHPAAPPNPDALDTPSLDPEDWGALRDLGRRMVDDMVEWMSTQRERPLHNPVPAEVAAGFEAPLPRTGEGAEEVYGAFRREVLPYPHGNTHPRFWGWVVGSGTPMGMLADMLAAGMNSNSGFGDQAVVHVERQVLRWLREAVGFPLEGGGILTSGCSVANLSGLTVARNHRAGRDVRNRGVASGSGALRVYGSSETHSSVHRACEILGIGRESLREVPVDDGHRISIAALRERIARDRAEGDVPFALVANAGTVNIGAFDDLEAMADVAEAEGLWLHVDGAFGALVALSQDLRAMVRGLERADSVAFDLHKWLHVPYDAGCVLFRDKGLQTETFRMSGAYLQKFESRLATGPDNLMDMGLQMSRGFRALKAWMMMRHYGFDRLAEGIERNVEQARYLAAKIDATPHLERMAEVPLNIVNFRYRPDTWDSDDPGLDELNRNLLASLHQSGVAAPSYTTLDGHFVLRVAITNHRSRTEDFDTLIDWLVEEAPRHTVTAIR